MDNGWDLTANNRDNQLMLVVEVKSKLGATPEWAAQLRRNILAHGIFPNAPYFLIAFPDRLYLWKNSISSGELMAPTYAVDARPIFQPYFERAAITAEKVSGQSFEFIVSSWLSELMHRRKDDLANSEQWLLDSGLYDAIAGGKLNHEVAA